MTPVATLPLSAFEEAARLIAAAGLHPTPCLPLEDGIPRAGRLLIKAESLQPTGSFKIRGATARIACLTSAEKKRGVIAYSTGNHAQAVAKAARDQGVAATIVMSPDVPAAKIAATRNWGATVVLAEPTSAARRALAETMAAEQELTLIPPYDDTAIMAGQGTIGLELLEIIRRQPPGTAVTVYVPVGGGGLLAGVAAALRQNRPDVRVIGVEPELEDDGYRSFRADKLLAADGPSRSIADAIKVQQLGTLAFPVIQQFVSDFLLVSEAEIAAATLKAARDLRLMAEPGGSVGFAAALRAAATEPGLHIALLCGGNITPERLADLAREAQA
jgi:threonine dehydratase